MFSFFPDFPVMKKGTKVTVPKICTLNKIALYFMDTILILDGSFMRKERVAQTIN